MTACQDIHGTRASVSLIIHKCDETKPECSNCRSYQVSCSYRSDEAGLHMSKEVVTLVRAMSADNVGWLVLDSESAMALARFGAWTASTILDVDQNDLLERAFLVSPLAPPAPASSCLRPPPSLIRCPSKELALTPPQNPYLRHAILAVTAIHDRHRGSPLTADSSHREAYYASQGAALLHQKLSEPTLPQDKDTLWMAATFLGIVAFSSNISDTPETSWPLMLSEPTDLGWLRMTATKRAIWELADALQPDGIFRNMAKDLREMYTPLPTAPIEGAPAALLRVCQLGPSSSAADNPYYTAVRTLVPLLSKELRTPPKGNLLCFLSQMQPEFRTLLYQRDSVALLILALWYEKSRHHVWWIWHRATVEYQAIALYLRRLHWNNHGILELLP